MSMAVIKHISQKWVEGIIKRFPIKRVDMSLGRTFGVEGVCVIYTTRDSSELAYLIVTRDSTGEILILNEDIYIEQQLRENLFNVEPVIRTIVASIKLREFFLKQVEGVLATVNLPMSIDVKTRTLFHVTPSASIERFHIDPQKKNVVDLRYLGFLSKEKAQAIEVLRNIGVTVWVKEKNKFLR
jgi:hypothetical protein